MIHSNPSVPRDDSDDPGRGRRLGEVVWLDGREGRRLERDDESCVGGRLALAGGCAGIAGNGAERSEEGVESSTAVDDGCCCCCPCVCVCVCPCPCACCGCCCCWSCCNWTCWLLIICSSRFYTHARTHADQHGRSIIHTEQKRRGKRTTCASCSCSSSW